MLQVLIITRRRRRFLGGGLLVFPASTTDRDVAEGSAFGPIAAAGFAEVSGLGEAVVVVVAKFGVRGFASGAFQGLFMLRSYNSPL